MDSAEYELRAAFKRTAPAEVKTSFPSEVELSAARAGAPKDDTPATYKPPAPAVRTTVVRKPKPKPEPEQPKSRPLSGRITAVSVVNNKTQITIASHGHNARTHAGTLKGAGSFTLEGCTERRCKRPVRHAGSGAGAGDTVSSRPSDLVQSS